jgi:hypothetical protein
MLSSHFGRHTVLATSACCTVTVALYHELAPNSPVSRCTSGSWIFTCILCTTLAFAVRVEVQHLMPQAVYRNLKCDLSYKSQLKNPVALL